MSTIYVGSARHDENGKYVNGKAGDQTQTNNTNDLSGEVSMQKMYTHSKGWYILRPKKIELANSLADAMITACNNKNLGYDQYGRGGVITNGINSNVATECDCSSLVRACVKAAAKVDPGNFTTDTEVKTLSKTGLFEEPVAYVSQTKTPVYNGDILVTKTKGHTVIVVKGSPRQAAQALKSNEEIADEVIALKWGTGTARKTALTNAGYDYAAIQAIVNAKTKQAAYGTKVYATVSTSGSNLALRDAAGNQINTIKNGTKVEVVKKDAKTMTIRGEKYTMCQIKDGYVAQKYLKF